MLSGPLPCLLRLAFYSKQRVCHTHTCGNSSTASTTRHTQSQPTLSHHQLMPHQTRIPLWPLLTDKPSPRPQTLTHVSAQPITLLPSP